mgnify:CR=1 FL=1
MNQRVFGRLTQDEKGFWITARLRDAVAVEIPLRPNLINFSD